MIGDNYDLYSRYEQEQARRAKHLPKCINCGEPIQQVSAVRIDNEWWCDDCLDDQRKVIEEW